jgi:hypothetical protein
VWDEGQPSWERFKELFHLQFGPPVRGSRLAELGHIQFHSTVQDYTDHFNTVLCHAQNLDSSQKADLYVGGLPDHGLTSSSAPLATYGRQSTSPGRLSSVPAPCWHNNRRRCHASAASRAPCRRHGRPCYHRCHQQPVLPSQAHSSRQHSSRSASIAASRRQNNLSVVVKGYATVMSPSSAVTSASACSTSSWATTRTTTTPPRTLR